MTIDIDISQAAAEWAARGLKVLPLHWPISSTQCSCSKIDCKSIGKHPISELTRHGLKDATRDPRQISAWWQIYPEANVAVVTGGGIVVLDEDVPGSLGTFAAGRDLPKTFAVSTGRGMHHYYRIDGPVKNRAGLAPGLDVRGDNGYVVAPPSIHYTGTLYEVADDSEIAPCPAWLVDVLQPKAQAIPQAAMRTGLVIRGVVSSSEQARLQVYVDRAISQNCMMISTTAEGGRNHTLNDMAFRCGTLLSAPWAMGLVPSRSEVESRLLQAALASGLTERESLRTIKSGLDSGIKRPRIAPPQDRQSLAAYVKHTAMMETAREQGQETASAPTMTEQEVIEVRKEIMGELAKDPKTDKVCRTPSNLYRILQAEPLLQGCIVYNAFGRTVCSLREPPAPQGLGCAEVFFRGKPWSDTDSSRLRVWLHDTYGVTWSLDDIHSTIDAVADSRHWHPVKERLEALEWHGEPLLDRWLVDYLGADDTPYTRAVSRKWLISAVARVYEPGCKAECMLVLEGEQGIGKSTAIRVLALDGAWFSDSELSLDDPAQSAQALHGKLIVEVPELAALSKSQVETIKAYLSRQTDHYRAPYDRRPQSIPRQSVFAGSTNDTQYLKDSTGNRRFWPIRCAPASGRADIQGLQAVSEQLWAEARQAYLTGETWWLDDTDHEALAMAKDVQESRTEDDPWVDILRSRLPQGLPYYITDDVAEALGIDLAKLDPRTASRFAKVLKVLGLAKRRLRVDGQQRWVYCATLTEPVLPSCYPTQDDRVAQANHAKTHSDSEVCYPVLPSPYKRGRERERSTIGSTGGTGSTEVGSKFSDGQGSTGWHEQDNALTSQEKRRATLTLVEGWHGGSTGVEQGSTEAQEGYVDGQEDPDVRYAREEREAIQAEAAYGEQVAAPAPTPPQQKKCPYGPEDALRYRRWHEREGLPIPKKGGSGSGK